MMEQKLKTRYSSNKEETLRGVLSDIAQSDRFMMVTLRDNVKKGDPPVRVVALCDDGKEQETLAVCTTQAIHVLQLLDAQKEKS